MVSKIPRYKYWLSHFGEQVLETTSSEYNNYLAVSLVGGRLQLVAEDAIYSFGDYYLNFRTVFDKFNYRQLPARASVLVLGLGLGSIPELLEKYIGVQYDYVAVEIDPVIIELASEYSLPALRSSIEVVQADALSFLQLDERTFDLICVDVFQDADIPPHLTTEVFLGLLRDTLAPEGALIYNRLADTDVHREEACRYYEDIFQPMFPGAAAIDTGGNYMLINQARFV